MNTPNKFNIRTAAHKQQKFVIPAKHRTTIDFMQLQPVYYRHLVPNQSIDINARAFARLAAMVVPTFGDANLHLNAFFVPYKQVVPYFDSFMTDSVYIPHNTGTAGIPTGMPYLTIGDLVTAFCTETNGFVRVLQQSESVYDIRVLNADTSYTPYIFTRLGRQVYKIMLSLGYRFDWDKSSTTKISAVPLLCFLKVYIDHFWPAAYQNTPIRDNLELWCKKDSDLAGFQLRGDDFVHIITELPYVTYDSDYFTSAFDNPVGPNSNQFSSFSITDTTLPDSFVANNRNLVSVDSNNNGTPLLSKGLSQTGPISQFALDNLKALSDYMKRHQLAGSKMLERFLARFDVKPNPIADGRCIKIGSASVPLSVADVMSTAETEGSNLGDYAGKGFIRDLDGSVPHFHFESGEFFGMVIITASLVPSIGYVQGIDRHNLELGKLDFYNPEFDALGSQAISSAELFIPTNPQELNNDSPFDYVFGFIPRDAHRKIGHDWLSGDYTLATLNQSGDASNAWHTYRLFDGSSFNNLGTDIAHSIDFIQGKDAVQYDRMFYNTEASADHFYLDCFFDVTTYAPMKSLYDVYEFKNDEHQDEVTVNNTQTN